MIRINGRLFNIEVDKLINGKYKITIKSSKNIFLERACEDFTNLEDLRQFADDISAVCSLLEARE